MIREFIGLLAVGALFGLLVVGAFTRTDVWMAYTDLFLLVVMYWGLK